MDNNVEVSGSEARSSIEVSENNKNQFSYKIKFYFNKDTENSLDVIDKIKESYDKVHEIFGGK